MKLVDWHTWINDHIPYYEIEKQCNRFKANPPSSVLIIYPNDPLRRNLEKGKWTEWDTVAERIIEGAAARTVPLFLERDTKQEWYWAFWDSNDALLAMMKLG